MINPKILVEELRAADIECSGCNSNGLVWALDGETEIQDEPAVAAIVAAHDPTDFEQIRQEGAESKASQVPGWATWTEAEALAWIADNAEAELAGSAPKTLQMLKAMARLIIVLRDRTMPGLRGHQSDE